MNQYIPYELLELNQWLVWKLVPAFDSTGKDQKIPVSVKTEKGASTTNPQTWARYDEVLEFLEEWQGHDHSHWDNNRGELTGKVMGPGFVFSRDDPYTGIDLDNCIDSHGNLEPWAKNIVDAFNSFTEISQSGTGLHIIIKAKKPDGFGCKRGNIECYDHSRFFAITGKVYKEAGHAKY